MEQQREIVKYDNTINSLKFKNFTQKDFDFFWAICSQVSEKGNVQVALSFQELRELTDYKETDRSRMSADLDRMFQKLLRIVYRYEDEEAITMFNLFSKYKILKTRDELQVRVTEEFLPLLNNLESRFTSFELRELVGLTSKHSKTLYRILKQWRTQGKTQAFTLEDLKELFDSSTMRDKDFMLRVLKPSVDEINERDYFRNLTMLIKHDEKKRGKPIKNLLFSFEKEEIKKNNSEQVEGQMDIQDFPTYLPSQSKKSKNKFNDYPQRKYTDKALTELEQALLNR